MGRFDDKVVIVTGSSIGIGRATAILFAREGAKVTITGRNSDFLGETKKQILKIDGIKNDDRILEVIADITETKGIEELVEKTIAKFGRLDILVNNAGAGFADPNGKVGVEASLETYEKTFDLNVKSIIALTQKCRPHLIASQGEIVNVSSIAAMAHANTNFSYYCMAKAALDSFTRSAAIDLIAHRVRVNSVSPGITASHFLNAVGLSEQGVKKCYEYYAEHPDIIPSGGAGRPEEIAEVIAFLADRKASSFIVGQSIVADGGTSLIMAMNTHDLMDIVNS